MSKKIWGIIDSIAIALLIFASCFIIRIKFVHALPYKEYTWTKLEYNIIRPYNWDEERVREEIDKLLDVNYSLLRKDLPGNILGKANLITFHIDIEPNLSLEMYTFTLTHEITHLKYYTVNERFTNYYAWLILYESGIDYFKQVALAIADQDFRGLTYYDYSCAGYIEEYLRGK